MDWQEFIFNKFPFLHRWIRWAKRVTLPGFDGVPLYDVLVFVITEIQKDAITIRAAAVAFNFMLAVFPTMIFFFTLIPYIPAISPEMTSSNMRDMVLEFMSKVLPLSAYDLLKTTIVDTITIPRGGLLSFGFIMALYFSTNGVNSMMSSFDKTYDVFKKRNFLQSRWVALKLTIFLALLVIFSVIFIIAGNYFIDLLLEFIEVKATIGKYAISLLRWLVILSMFFIAISLMYYYGPAIKQKFRFISAGSTTATLLSIVTSLGFSYYVNNYGTYNKLYGFIGNFIVIMLWFYFNAFVLLIGFELNASIAVNKEKKGRGKESEFESEV